MKKRFRTRNELIDVTGDTCGIVIALLLEWSSLDFKDYQYKIDCLADSLLKIPFEMIPTQSDRNFIVEYITEEHFRHFGSHPKRDVLNKLGDFILLDYIKSRNKSKFDQNTFHTQKQLKRRMSKEFSTESDTMDFLHSKMALRIPSLYKKTKKAVE